MRKSRLLGVTKTLAVPLTITLVIPNGNNPIPNPNANREWRFGGRYSLFLPFQGLTEQIPLRYEFVLEQSCIGFYNKKHRCSRCVNWADPCHNIGSASDPGVSQKWGPRQGDPYTSRDGPPPTTPSPQIGPNYSVGKGLPSVQGLP